MPKKIRTIKEFKAYIRSLRDRRFSGTVRFDWEGSIVVRIYEKDAGEEGDGKLIAAEVGADDEE